MLKTLDGANAVIKLRYKPFTNCFTIAYSTSKLILPNYWALGEIKGVNKKFLKIRYYIRGGSGTGRGNTVLLCISHGKLRQAMHIESYSSDLDYTSGYENTTQKIVDTRLTLDAKNRIHAITYDTLVAGQNQNFQRNSIAIRENIVRFNSTKDIFFNYQKHINTNLITFNYKSSRTIKKRFTGTVPIFQLNNAQYIFVGSNWYIKDDSKERYFLVD